MRHLTIRGLFLSFAALGACGAPPDPLEQGADEAVRQALTCSAYDSQEQEFAPIQVTGPKTLPAGWNAVTWQRPTTYNRLVAFKGTTGRPASHEGTDYVNDRTNVATVAVNAAASGTVVYVRTGCPQSAVFSPNQTLRECGSGWGNHVVVAHGNALFTRYAHLEPGSVAVAVGETVARAQRLGTMGNSGRSDVRHLHFEFGKRLAAFDACAPAQSMDNVWDPERLFR